MSSNHRFDLRIRKRRVRIDEVRFADEADVLVLEDSIFDSGFFVFREDVVKAVDNVITGFDLDGPEESATTVLVENPLAWAAGNDDGA